MHGEVRVTVIATGFDRAVTGDQPLSRTSGAAGVLNFPQRQAPRHSTPGIAAPPQAQPTPRPQPRVSQAPATPPATDVPEMEIPTFIRRQMD
jgi:hypothetical protein